MRSKVRMALVVILGTVLISALPPRPARAISDSMTLPLIISGAVAGTVLLVTMIAIMGAGHDQPEMLMPEASDTAALWRRSNDRLRFGIQCPSVDGNLTLACW